MSHVFVDGLPGLSDFNVRLTLQSRGESAVIRSPEFLARVSLEPVRIEWICERSRGQLSDSARKSPRRMSIPARETWLSDDVVVELVNDTDGGVIVIASHTETGKRLWESFVPVPMAADWAEPAPAWPDAQTEEINVFLGSNPTSLVIFLSRQSRRSMCWTSTITVDTLPDYNCQLDAVCLDPSSGAPVWRNSYPGLAVGIHEQRSFLGIWSNGRSVGYLDFKTGTNRVLQETDNVFGWPVAVDSQIAVPWHSKGEVGILRLDDTGNVAGQMSRKQSRVRNTRLHTTEAGLALQVNDQTLIWCGHGDAPAWDARAKPYIYRVHSGAGSDLFVGTDGRGGRLLAFDRASGAETMNLKPALGGAGTVTKVPCHDVLVADFLTSRNYSSGRLLVLAMSDRSHQFECESRRLLGVWDHGAVCLGGKEGDRLVVVDLRG